jgi:hypothetical protein
MNFDEVTFNKVIIYHLKLSPTCQYTLSNSYWYQPGFWNSRYFHFRFRILLVLVKTNKRCLSIRRGQIFTLFKLTRGQVSVSTCFNCRDLPFLLNLLSLSYDSLNYLSINAQFCFQFKRFKSADDASPTVVPTTKTPPTNTRVLTASFRRVNTVPETPPGIK